MPKKILLADDSITIQKVVELTFSDGDYEVTAVNNGAKAIQKLAEMRPDIILSDIIMPEKNGYEVCEFVKSHPEFRNIPIILLTGTFEPFDPDRAEKAGCDAVVTKPFESQSLIHKVEELIAQSSPAGGAEEAAPQEETWATGAADQPAWDSTPPPAAEAAPAWGEPQPGASPFARAGEDAADLFGGGPEAPPPTVEVPYNPPPAESPFLREEAPPAPPAQEASPWEEQPAYSGETRAFTKMSFDDFDKMAAPAEAPAAEPAPPPQDLESPFGAPPPAEQFSGETRAFTKLSFDDLQRMATGEPDTPPPAPEPAAPPQPEAAPWEDVQPAAAAPAWPEPPAPAPAEASPWDEQPAFSGETRTFTKMSFEDLQKMAGETAQPSAPAWEAPPAEQEPAFAEQAPAFTEEAPAPAAAPEPESLPWSAPSEPAWQEEPAAAEPPPAPLPFEAAAAPEPSHFFAGDRAESEAVEEAETPPSSWPAATQEPPVSPAAAAGPFELTDEMVDRIARRVVELMSDQVVRSIAWEVIPDAAEIAIKERIRQLEAEEA